MLEQSLKLGVRLLRIVADLTAERCLACVLGRMRNQLWHAVSFLFTQVTVEPLDTSASRLKVKDLLF
jgi:hypothetical protein